MYALCVICFVKSGVASLSDYYPGQSSLESNSDSQAYKYGDGDSLAQVIALPGKQSTNRPVFASAYTGNSYVGNIVPDRGAEVYSFTHSGHPPLDLTGHTESDQGYNAPTNNYVAVDSGMRHNDGVYNVKQGHLTGFPLASLLTTGVKPLQPLYHRLHFLSGHSGNHGPSGTLSLGYNSFGRPHDVKGNYIKHPIHSSAAGTQSVGSSHASAPSSAYLNYNDGDHSYFHSLAEALARGWSALLND